jgi:hypothetical protein
MKSISHKKPGGTRRTRAVGVMRKSHCADQSFAAELRRLRGMSIEDRVREALGLNAHVAPFRAGPQPR